MDEEQDISKTLWVNVFADADLEALVAELEPADADAFAAARETLDAREGWSGSLEWIGLPWRWSIVYTARHTATPALAYLIPDPRGSRVCIPVPASGPGAPEIGSLTKPVRKVVEQSAIVAGFLWPEWACADFDAVALESLLNARDTGA